MSRERSKKETKKRRVTFLFDAPEAKEVMLLGDFNKWEANSHPMKREKDGVWKKIVMLVPGRYEYKFLVDGQWQIDPRNDQVCINSFGSKNNVLTVSLP